MYDRKQIIKDLDIPGFIDIIFLLLIFSMSTVNFERQDAPEETPGKSYPIQVRLPLVTKAGIPMSDPTVVNNLLIILGREEADSTAQAFEQRAGGETFSALILLPPDSLRRAYRLAEEQGRMLAFQQRGDGSVPARLQTLLHTELRRYFSRPEHLDDIIEIRADSSIQFGVINYIFQQVNENQAKSAKIKLHLQPSG